MYYLSVGRKGLDGSSSESMCNMIPLADWNTMKVFKGLASLLLISLLVSPLFISCVHADEDELEEEEEGVVEVLTFNTLLGILSILAMPYIYLLF